MKDKTLDDYVLEQIRQLQLQKDLRNFKEAEKLFQNVFEEGKEKIDRQYHDLIKGQKGKKKIQRSALINHYRMLKATKKFRLCQNIFQEVQKRIQTRILNNPKQYQLTLISFITEGAIRMFEEKCKIRCLERDIKYVQQVLLDCIDTFHSVMEQEIGRKYKLELIISKDYPIQNRQLSKTVFLQKKQEDVQGFGGVILTDQTGNIIYKNTFDARINILRQISLPGIRYLLWK